MIIAFSPEPFIGLTQKAQEGWPTALFIIARILTERALNLPRPGYGILSRTVIAQVAEG